MASFIRGKWNCVVFMIIVSMLLTFVKYSSARNVVFKERHHAYFNEEGGYYLFDKDLISEDFDVTEHDGERITATEEDSIKEGFDDKSRTKRNAFSSSSRLIGNSARATFILPDTLPQLLIHWMRNNSSAIVVMTRKLKFGRTDVATESNLYFSYDYGRTFQKSTLRNTISQFFVSVVDFRRILFADVDGQNIITTHDIGRTFRTFSCPFKPSFVSLHPSRDSHVIAYDKYNSERALWLSTDFGQTWRNIQENVKKAYWGNSLFKNFEHPDALYVEKKEHLSKMYILKSETFFLNDSSEEYLISNVDKFFIRNDSLFAVRFGENYDYDLLITMDRHSPFLLANFPTTEQKKEFFIVDVADNQMMVLVSFRPGKTHLYISEPNTVNFKLSLENVIYSNPDGIGATFRIKKKEPIADIHKVKGLRSVFIANTGIFESNTGQYNLNNMRTVISFDKGATWENVSAPIMDSHGRESCPGSQAHERCTLQISLDYHSLHSSSLSTPIVTETSSPGYIFATGVAGIRVSGSENIYFSANGGKTWKEARDGEGYYNWADHGGIIAFVKSGVKNNMLRYSIDEGHTWNDVIFYSVPIMVYALLTEPGQTSTAFTAFGVTRSRNWVLAQVDLREVYEDRVCEPRDYFYWSPADIDGIPCLLGSKFSFERRHGYNSIPCLYGKDFDRQSLVESCPCTESDFECARGFNRDLSSESFSCIRSPNNNNNDVNEIYSICRTVRSYNKTRGYQKILGDKCSGGDAETQYGPIETPCPK